MKSIDETKRALNFIREVLDKDVMGADIDSQVNKLISLTQLMGLSAETMASSKKILHMKELQVFQVINPEMPPSMQTKRLSSECYEELSMLQCAELRRSAY